MKTLIITICFLCYASLGISQNLSDAKDTVKVILENDDMIVTEYISTPGKDVCGSGEHTHKPHLSILLTDVSVLLTADDGTEQEIDLKEGATFWSEAETHTVINTGDQPTRVYLVESK